MNDPGLRERNIDAVFALFGTDADGVITSDGPATTGALASRAVLSNDQARTGTSMPGQA